MKGARPTTSEDGSVLLMALVFMSLFGLAIAAVLGFAGTGFRTAASVHTRGEQQYAADAAVDGAINAIRGDVSIGKAGVNSTCFSLPAVVNSTAVSVQCLGRPGSGVVTGGAGGGAVPANAVLTLPTDATEGVVQTATSSALVSGSVTTNQSRTAPAGSALTVQGTLTCRVATGAGTVTATVVNCPAAVTPAATDPAYAAVISNAPAPATVPTTCPAATVTFSPGLYQSAAALNALTSGACTNKTFHFPPGAYYFEFTDAGTHEWRVADASAQVVGGTLTASPFPNRCDLAQAGVQFIFGADSRLAVTAGSLELCPPLSAGQRIAVYGVPSTTTPINVTSTLAATTSVNTGSIAFANPADGAVVDGTSAAITLCNKCTGTLTLTGYPAAGVPSNAVITSAVMRITNSRSATRGTVNARLTAGDATFADFAVFPCVQPCAVGTTVTSVDVLSVLGTPARVNGLSVQYSPTDSPGLNAYTVYLDGVVVDVTYTIPPLVASSGCLLVAPYSPGNAATCAVLKGTGSASTRMAVKGTVYVPLAPVDLSMTGQSAIVTQRGIIARTLYLGLTAGAGFAGPLLSLPGAGDRQVLFTASIAGTPALRADATFVDGNGTTPGASVAVTAWSVLR